MMDSLFTRITETNKSELYLPNSKDRVYYTELNEWYTTGAFRNFSVKIVLDKQINYRVGSKEINVTADKCLLAVKQPEVKAYYTYLEPVKSICVDIDENTITEVYSVLSHKNACLDNAVEDYFSIPDFNEDVFFYRNSHFASRIEKLANDITSGNAIHLDKEWFYGICEEIIYRQYGKYLAFAGLDCIKQATKKELLHRLETAKEYIETNFLHITSIHEIARAACLSDYHFVRSFRMAYKVSPYKYVLQQRLLFAQQLMKQRPGAGLKVIAALCNFPDIASFSKAYKRCFKVSPSMFVRN